jgi:hypothetical protein
MDGPLNNRHLTRSTLTATKGIPEISGAMIDTAKLVRLGKLNLGDAALGRLEWRLNPHEARRPGGFAAVLRMPKIFEPAGPTT